MWHFFFLPKMLTIELNDKSVYIIINSSKVRGLKCGMITSNSP